MTPQRKLASAWRLLGSVGHVDSIFNHISFFPGDSRFWINRQESVASQALSSTFVDVDLDRAEYDPPPKINRDGWQLHRSIHRARGKAGAAIHTHAPFAVAVANSAEGLQPTSQAAMELIPLLDPLAYDGRFRDLESSATVSALASRGGVLLLQSHGLLTIADSIEEATYLAYYLEEACRVQVLTMSQGSPPSLPSLAAVTRAADAMRDERSELAVHWFEAMTVDVEDAST